MNVSRCISGALLGFFLAACGSTDVHAPPSVAPTRAAESPDDKATSDLPKACKETGGQACYDLGVQYEQGTNVKQDSSRAAALFEKACDDDIAIACFDLAVFAENGRGVAKDGARAAALYSKACDGGDGRGCINLHTDTCNRGEASGCLALADMFEAGDRVTQDLIRATEFASKACEAGHFPSCSKAGLALSSEEPGSVNDFSRAAVLFTKGCDGNDAPSCSGLAVAYANGRGVAKDEKRAIDLAVKACGGGVDSSCALAGNMYLAGRGVPKNKKRALELFTPLFEKGDLMAFTGFLQVDAIKEEKQLLALYSSACLKNDFDGCHSLANLYAKRRDIQAIQNYAYKLFLHACEHDSYKACYTLGRMYRDGTGVKRDQELAVEPLKKACVGDIAEACLAFGDIGITYANDPKISKDDKFLVLTRAKKVYEQACELGNKVACKKAARIF